MSKLLISSIAPDELQVKFRMGGRPLVPANIGFKWPDCPECGIPMCFYGQIPLVVEPNLIALLFICHEDCCSIWEPNQGNQFILVKTKQPLELLTPPNDACLLNNTYGAIEETPSSDNYFEALSFYNRNRASSEDGEVIGQTGGSPVWYQGEEYVVCDECHKTMHFLGHFEEGPDISMNFCGGGIGYAFICLCNLEQPHGKFLIQC